MLGMKSFTLEPAPCGDDGSFTCIGAGLNYAYQATENRLIVRDPRFSDILLIIYFDQQMKAEPLEFLNLFEKTISIKALVYSQNQSEDICELFEGFQLHAVLKHSAMLTRYAFNLKTQNFKDFEKQFCNDAMLAHFKIKHIKAGLCSKPFYGADLYTTQGNHISARSKNIHRLMRKISEKTMRDLIVKEYDVIQKHKFKEYGAFFVNMSSNLSILSQVLNPVYYPASIHQENNTALQSLRQEDRLSH